MNKSIDFSNISQAALNAAETLLAGWLPNGKRDGHEYKALNPTRADSKIGSFSVNVNNGKWADFATGDEGGDLISLYAYLFGVKQGEAAKEIAKLLNMDTIPAAPISAAAQTAKLSPQKMTDDKWESIAPVPEKYLHSLHAEHGFKKNRLFESIYRDENGKVLGMVVRFANSDGGHEDIPRTFGLDKVKNVMEWRWRLWDGLRYIYGLDVLAAKPDAPVLIVEGEKCKNITQESGEFDDFAVISWLGGCKNWEKTDWTKIKNRRVVLFPDADSHHEKASKREKEQGITDRDKPLLPAHEQGGMKAMLGIEQRLCEQGCETAIVQIPPPGTWPSGYDIADMLTDVDVLANPRELVEEALARISSTPTLSVLLVRQPENGENSQSTDASSGQTVYNRHFAQLQQHFVLIEGKKAAADKRNGTSYSYQALKARFCKDSVDSWFNQPDKPMITQYEVKRLKEDFELKHRIEDNEHIQDMMDRYVYLDGSSSVWDNQLWRIIEQGAAKLAMGDEFKYWVNSPDRKVIPIDNIVFDPRHKDLGDNYINLFRGLPMQPNYPIAREQMPQSFIDVVNLFPDCHNIVKLVKHLCNDDWFATQFVLNWLAYPLQYMGAKLTCCLVFHGEVHGAGKSWLFDEIMGKIYGEHGGHYGQEDLESMYTANRSAKLYGSFEEVFNNQQKYSNTGKIKNLITRKTQRIERKFVDAMDEANYINCVFTSNEEQPYKLDENDRRAFVQSPQRKLPEELKAAISEEIANNGIQAFYSLLMSLPLTLDYEYIRNPDTGLDDLVVQRETPIRFDANTEAPMTEAKKLVISFGRFAWQAFFHEWENGDIMGILFGICFVDDLYALYEWWCRRNRETAWSRRKFSDHIATKMKRSKRWWRAPNSNTPDQKKQNVIFTPKNMTVPDDMVEMDYIGSSALRFKWAVNDIINKLDDE